MYDFYLFILQCVDKLIPTVVALSSEKTDVYISYEDRDLGNKRELLKAFLTVSI